jgi:hypothetical protein
MSAIKNRLGSISFENTRVAWDNVLHRIANVFGFGMLYWKTWEKYNAGYTNAQRLIVLGQIISPEVKEHFAKLHNEINFDKIMLYRVSCKQWKQ